MLRAKDKSSGSGTIKTLSLSSGSGGGEFGSAVTPYRSAVLEAFSSNVVLYIVKRLLAGYLETLQKNDGRGEKNSNYAITTSFPILVVHHTVPRNFSALFNNNNNNNIY
jgi:hypothetical protein